MKTGVSKSVGKAGANEKSDVLFVQSSLNVYTKFHKASIPPLKEDGLCGSKTIHAISVFQCDYVGMVKPDGRVDPNGRTLRYLTMHLSPDTLTKKHKTPQLISTSPLLLSGINDIHVTYSSSINENRRIVSAYAMNVVKIALKECGMNHAVITSTLRTPEDQAEIMYKNAKIDLAKQKALYGRNGDEVLAVYEDNKNKPNREVVKLMKEKIDSLLNKDKKVSNHCITIDAFKKMNTFDIGLNSTKAKSKNFSKEKLTSAFADLKKQGYIKNFIDETMKSNSCWHLEIIPHIKDLNIYGKASMLFLTKHINGAYV